jgi:hypothetical protein
MMLTHRIVAMVGPKPARVQCETCHSQHNFREHPPGESPAKASASGSSAPRPTRVSNVTRLEQERRDRENLWERACTGRLVSDFIKYNPKESFKIGDLVKHTKFGDGVVLTILDAHKIEILFRDEPRKLAQALA